MEEGGTVVIREKESTKNGSNGWATTGKQSMNEKKEGATQNEVRGKRERDRDKIGAS